MAVRRGSADGPIRTIGNDTAKASVRSLLEIELPDWHKDAVCASTDPGAYFPDKGESTMAAKRVCWASCLVREECLEFALKNGERYGVWGGLSERERRKVARDRGYPTYQHRRY